MGCMKLADKPNEFIVATNFFPIFPLLPTPMMIVLPSFKLVVVIASTALTNPPRAVGLVAYRRERYDKAVASVDRTFTAVARMRSTSGSASVAGGVAGSVGIISEMFAGESGCGPWLFLSQKLRKKSASEGKAFILAGSVQRKLENF